jgi:hypothetical protein
LLADQVKVFVHKAQEKKAEDSLRNAGKSKEFKQLKELASQRDKLTKKMELLEDKISKRFKGVDVSTVAKAPRLYKRTNWFIDVKDARQKILVANHVNGIALDKLVEHVAKEYISTNN